ncbi:12249_t:CDS:1 [Entrophospora sp. SA101]|nr:3375_t:CDS:1 [Entrophospora sp. SA101]CAJ0840817.1 12249_t:CDS:1 [Entrophospora sp. SA101]
MDDQNHQNYFENIDTDFNNNDNWVNAFNNHNPVNQNLVSTNHQNLGDNNYVHQNSGGDNFDHQNSQNTGNNYTNQNFGEILQSIDNFNQNSSHNDIIYQNPITATNINQPNNPFGIGEGSYQNDYFQNSINSIITIDQNNNEQLLVHIESQLRNIQNDINQVIQFLNYSRNNNR